MTSPIATAFKEAAKKLEAFKLSTFQGEPNCQDADARSNDIEDLFENVLTPLLTTVAVETNSEFGVKINLTNWLDDVLGDALGALSKRADEMAEDEHGRASRSYMRASFAGTV